MIDTEPQINVAETLQAELEVALCDAVPTLTEAEAVRYVAPLVRYLQQQYGGERIYIPKPFRVVSAEQVVAAYNGGQSISEVCGRYGISRRTFYYFLSGQRRGRA